MTDDRHRLDDAAQFRLAADLLAEMVAAHPDGDTLDELADRLREIATRLAALRAERRKSVPVADKPVPAFSPTRQGDRHDPPAEAT